MTIVVRRSISFSSACCTSSSLAASSELVASSSRRIGGSFRIARAIAMRWRWPPDKRIPRSPRNVSYPCGSVAQELVGFGGARRRLDLGIGRVGPAVADVLARRGAEQHGVLRHEADRAAHALGIRARDVDAVDEHAAFGRIVEAQQQLERRALAGTGRADERDRLAGLDREREIVERQAFGARRIAETHVLELDAAAHGVRQRKRLRRRFDRRLGLGKLDEPLHGSGRALHLVPHLAQRRRGDAHIARVHEELAELAERHAAGEHLARADP